MRVDVWVPKLHNIRIGTCPPRDGFISYPHELNVIGVGNVERVVACLAGEKVECVIKYKLCYVDIRTTVDVGKS